MKIVSCTAQINFGKDELCDYLLLNLTGNWFRKSFAKPVKDIFCKTFGKDMDFIEKWKRNPECPPGMNKNVRESLQFIGDGLRSIDPYVWINKAFENETRNLIISDSRYFNESKAIYEKNGVTVVLNRPGFMNNDENGSEAEMRPIISFCANYLEDGPIPEYAFLKNKYGNLCPDEIQYYSYYLNNDKTLEDLYRKIDLLLIPFIEAKYGKLCNT